MNKHTKQHHNCQDKHTQYTISYLISLVVLLNKKKIETSVRSLYLLLMSKSKIVFFLFGDAKIEFHFEHAFLIIIVFDFASIRFLFREQQINRQEKHHVKK